MYMSLEMLWREERKCSATEVGLALVFKRRLVSPMYCRWHLLHWLM